MSHPTTNIDRKPAPGRRSAAAAQKSQQRAGRRLDPQWAMWIFIVPALLYLLIFFGYAIVKNVLMSFQDYTTATFYTGVAKFIGFQNYSRVFHLQVFRAMTVNTALFTLCSLAATFTIGLGLALFFNHTFKLSGLLRSLLLLPWLLPLIVSGAIWRRMMDEGSGILNQMLSGLGLSGVPWLTSSSLALVSVIIVNVWIGIPFVMVILYGGLQDIPRDFYEAASLDGAAGWRAFRFITWPLLRPVVLIVIMLGFVYTIRVLDIVLALTGGGPANATQTYATQAYQLSFVDFKFGQGAALSNILIVVSLLVAAFQLRANRRASDLAG